MRRDSEQLSFVYGPGSSAPFFVNMPGIIPFHLYFCVFALPYHNAFENQGVVYLLMLSRNTNENESVKKAR